MAKNYISEPNRPCLETHYLQKEFNAAVGRKEALIRQTLGFGYYGKYNTMYIKEKDLNNNIHLLYSY